jgi:hypothetical protein
MEAVPTQNGGVGNNHCMFHEEFLHAALMPHGQKKQRI